MPGNVTGNNVPANYSNSGGGMAADSGPYIGVVKDNFDSTRNGRVQVYLKQFGAANENDSKYWRVVSYMSPFFGTTPHKLHDTTDSKYELNGQSYGMWFTSPDVGVEVLCFFVNGDPNLGYYIGYIPPSQMNHMVPATGAVHNNEPNNATQEAAYSKADRLPVVEISKSDKNMNDADFYNSYKPVHSVIAAQLWAQGTLTDNVRGPIGTSSQRESPSYAYGINTPGRPVYAAGLGESNMKSAMSTGNVTADNVKVESRRGGHSFVMDDGDIDGNDVLMRLRTATGHQLTLSDDGACIYIQHANGQTWLEFGNEGTVDVFSTNSVNLRSNGDVNIHADNNINMHAGKNINMFAKENIKVEAEINLTAIGKQKLDLYSELTMLIKSDGTLATQSAQKTSIKAGGNIVEQGALILMNSGGADTIEKPIYIPHNSLHDTEILGRTGWASLAGKLDTITNRAPTHEPYNYHNQGVPVPVTMGAPGTPTPEPAKPQVQQKVAQAAKKPAPAKPAETADVAKQATETTGQKEVGPLKKSDVQSTLAQHAKTLAQEVNTVTEKGFGKFAVQPKMFEDLEILKPGIINFTSPMMDIYDKLSDPGMFTGVMGINSLDDFLSSETLQMDIAQKGMEYTESVLKQTGYLTGLESAFDSASILSASLVGAPQQVMDWVSGKGDALLDGAMDEVAKSSQYAVNLVAGPAKEVVNGILDTSASLGDAVSKVGNMDRSSLDAVTNALIGNTKIPNVEDIANKVKGAIDPSSIVSSVTDTFSKLDPSKLISELDPTELLAELDPNKILQQLDPGQLISDLDPGELLSKLDPTGLADNLSNLDPSNLLADLDPTGLVDNLGNLDPRKLLDNGFEMAQGVVTKKITDAVPTPIKIIGKFV